jgi:ATP-dependent Lon protease
LTFMGLQVIGAHRAQIKKVIIPWANRKDVEHDVTAKIRNSIEFVFVQTIEEVIQAAFGKGVVHRRMLPVYESRL